MTRFLLNYLAIRHIELHVADNFAKEIINNGEYMPIIDHSSGLLEL